MKVLSIDWLNIVSDLSQAFATLFAVLLAFLLSIFTERSSWKQRKKEQIREHQIDSLKILVPIIYEVGHFTDTIVKLRESVLIEINTPTLSPAQKSSKKSTCNSKIEAEIEKIEKLKTDCLKELWKLAVLKYSNEQTTIVQSYLDELEKVIVSFNSATEYIDNQAINRDALTILKSLSDKFINEADNGLTK